MAGAMKRSMAERLAALANPTPADVDTEDMPDGARVGAGSDEDEFVYDDYSGFMAQRSTLRQNLGLDVVDDPKYKGVRASRKDLMDADVSDEDDEEDEDEEFEEEEDEEEEEPQPRLQAKQLPKKTAARNSSSRVENNNEEADEDEDEESEGEGADEEIDSDEKLDAESGDEEGAEGEDGEDEDGEEGESEDEDLSGDDEEFNEVDEEEKRLREELEQIQAEEESGGISNFTRANVENEVVKGQHTRNQLALYDSLMETRIRLQQSVNICNRFAQYDVRPLFVERGGEEMKQAIDNATEATVALLDDLLELQEVCLRANAGEPIRTGAQKRKRPHHSEPEQYWTYIKVVSDEFTPYRNTVLTKWHNKTTLSSGGLSMTKQLRAINQGIMAQVEHMLADSDKLVQRTQLKRIALRPLGKVDKADGQTDLGEEIDKRNNPDNYDAEIFDDNDMYHQLLRDLIAARSRFSEGDDPAEMARAWLEVQKLRTKVKKKVDTKASKGRKIRYTVMNELVNFMFPVEKGTSDDATRTELCRSLFSAV